MGHMGRAAPAALGVYKSQRPQVSLDGRAEAAAHEATRRWAAVIDQVLAHLRTLGQGLDSGRGARPPPLVA